MGTVYRGWTYTAFELAPFEARPPGDSAMTIVTRAVCVTVGACLLLAQSDRPLAQSPYLTPPQAIVYILDAPSLPAIALSPTRSSALLLERKSMPSIAEVSEPMLRLAGMRISPRTNGLHRPGGISGLKFKSLPDGDEKIVKLPAGAIVQDGSFSPD